jgi:YbbR domain-containing protein
VGVSVRVDRDTLFLKGIAIAVATFFWWIVSNDTRIATLVVPIEFKNPPPGKVIISEFSQQAAVKVTGPGFLITQLLASPPTISIKIPQEVERSINVSLDESSLSLPASVSVLALEPAEITINFDQKISKSVEIQVPRIGNLPSDYVIVNSVLEPARVLITGPAQELERIRDIETTPVDFRDITNSVTRDLELKRPSLKTSLETSKVNWALEVALVKVSKTFSAIPIKYSLTSDSGTSEIFPSKVKFQPHFVEVTVKGRRSAIRALTSADILPQVIIPSPNEVSSNGSSMLVPIKVNIPEGFEVTGIVPNEVTVNLPEKK